jgi:pimeloyl-ACP methyl ester carboxylesterase
MGTATAAVSATTAPNQSVKSAAGVRFAYRRLGAPSGQVPPLVLLQHFRGNLDNWDPALIDDLSASRHVVTFDKVGVGGTNGTTPSSVEEMARGAIDFLGAMEFDQVDLLGFSIGSFVAQEIALVRPALVQRHPPSPLRRWPGATG